MQKKLIFKTTIQTVKLLCKDGRNNFEILNQSTLKNRFKNIFKLLTFAIAYAIARFQENTLLETILKISTKYRKANSPKFYHFLS